MSVLSQKAMYAYMSTGCMGNSRADSDATSLVAEHFAVSMATGSYRKSLLDKSALAEIKKVLREVKEYHSENTLYGSILPSKNYFAYTEAIRNFQARLDGAVYTLVQDYEMHKENARSTLNGLFKESDYPSVEDLSDKFSIQVMFEQIPSGEGFLVDLGEEETSRLRAEIEARSQEALKDASLSLFGRIYVSVKSFGESLEGLDLADGKVRRFQATWIQNIREIVDSIPRMNFSDDPGIEEARVKILDSLLSLDPQSLKNNPDSRKAAVSAVKTILEQMAGYCDPADLEDLLADDEE